MSAHNREIEQLYLRMYDFLLEYAKSSLGNYSLAEEAVQDTFQIACQKSEDLCNSKSPEGWLVNTLKNVISNTIRSRATANKILSEYLASQARDFAVTEDRVKFEILYENVADLEEFQLLKEMVIDGYSHLEMAKKRGISVETCRKRVQRAKDTLRKKIKK